MNKNPITAQIRPIETYSPEYLKQKAGIYRWRAENKETYKRVIRDYSAIYRARYPLTLIERSFWCGMKKIIRRYFEGGTIRAHTLARIKAKTGLELPELIKHLGYDLCSQWVYNGRSYQIDHIVPLSNLERAGMMDKASHYSNVRITLRQINQSWGCRINDKASKRAVEDLVRLTLNQKIGLN